MFSVVIPLYNSEKYIIETLLSLANQTFKDFEVIIVDDQSTDNGVSVTQKFIQENPEIRIKLYADRPNEKYPKGVSGSRNFGISKATGEWIGFLDSDDLFHPRKLEILFQLILILPSDVKAFHHNLIEFTDGEKVIFKVIETVPISVRFPILEELVIENRIATSTVILKKDIFIDSGYFDTSLDGVEDYYLWLHISRLSGWHFLPLQLTAYRVRIGSLMGGRKFEHYISQNTLLVNKLKKNPLFLNSHKKNVEKYFMFNIMKYYASISINRFGWGNFFKGLTLLTINGYWNFALKIGFINVKFLLLKILSKLKNNDNL